MAADPVTFEHFEIARRENGSLHELGRGAMGVTYKALDTRLGSHVALKVINADYLNDEVARERFLREARAAAHLNHPNVAAIFHRGQDGGTYFYAMQFIEGETFDAFIKRRGPLDALLALRLILQAAQGLAAASERGLIHRDIKPANLMLVHNGSQDDEDLLVKIIDFGLAKSLRKDAGSTEVSLTGGGPIGTPYYMSPEQIDPSMGDIDSRTDIYSLGVTLWYLLAGKPPFVGSQFQVFNQHMHKAPPLETLTPVVPAPVSALLSRMLAKDPADRPANHRELIGAIKQLLRGPAVTGAPGTDLSGAHAPVILPEKSGASSGLISPQPLPAPSSTLVDAETPPVTAVRLRSSKAVLVLAAAIGAVLATAVGWAVMQGHRAKSGGSIADATPPLSAEPLLPAAAAPTPQVVAMPISDGNLPDSTSIYESLQLASPAAAIDPEPAKLATPKPRLLPLSEILPSPAPSSAAGLVPLPSLHPAATPALRSYRGNVGNVDTEYSLQWDEAMAVSGTYTYPGRRDKTIYKLKGTNDGNGHLEMKEYTGGNVTATIKLTKTIQNGEIIWSGKMYNTDGRVLNMTMKRRQDVSGN